MTLRSNGSLLVIAEVAALLLFSSSSALWPQAPLQVVDANDSVLGPVIGLRTDGSSGVGGYFFMYDQGGESAMLVLETPNRIVGPRTNIYLYYTSISCDNTPAVASLIDCCPPPLISTVIPDLDQLWDIDLTSTLNPLVTARRPIGSSQSSGACEILSPTNYLGHPVSAWGTLDFTAPLRLVRNPFIFGDDFSSGNLEAWSNY